MVCALYLTLIPYGPIYIFFNLKFPKQNESLCNSRVYNNYPCLDMKKLNLITINSYSGVLHRK